MDLRELIEAGATKAGHQKTLALAIGITEKNLSECKSGRRGLPDFACVNLANYLGMDPMPVIAASVLVTEKNEERRKVFYPFVMGRAATIAALTAIIGMTALPPEAQAAQGFSDQRSGAIGIM